MFDCEVFSEIDGYGYTLGVDGAVVLRGHFHFQIVVDSNVELMSREDVIVLDYGGLQFPFRREVSFRNISFLW